MKTDLHIHSIYSDGVFSPEQLIDTAIEIGLSIISITDHDNILGYKYAQAYLDKIKAEKEVNLEIIPGVEINTIYEGQEVHILGYHMDLEDSEFLKMINYQQKVRVKQTKQILENIEKKLGISISYSDVQRLVAEEGSIGRPHIAKALVNVGGVRNIMDAYNRYIHSGSEVYEDRKTVSPHEAVEIIYEAGGVPVIAHPCDIKEPEHLIEDLMSYGLRGIEAYHRKHSPAMVEYFSCIAEDLGLIVTGGSDFHAPNHNNIVIMGKNFVPEWVSVELTKEKKRLDLAR